MIVIKSKSTIMPDDVTDFIRFYRENPVIAARHLLQRDNDPVELAPVQQKVLMDWWCSKFSMTTASRGSGKAMSNGTKVLTNKGWVQIEDLRVGDEVINPRGNRSTITGVFPQGKMQVYRILFTDGRFADCSLDHWWKIRTAGSNSWQLLRTIDIPFIHAPWEVPTVKINLDGNFLQDVVQIEEIYELGNNECTCIKIEDPEGLFIIDDYIVTHNTFLGAVYIALKAMLYPNSRLGIFAPSYRQSKFIFNEFKLLYDNSPILQQCVNKEPSLGNEKCVCEFKSAGRGVMPSYIEALPVGSDGSKIRGKRFSNIILDECVQLPESIYRMAIKPMLSTSRNPMQKVKTIEKLQKEFNLDEIPNDLLSSENGYIAISSGYYQFNYWWPEILKFWARMLSGDSKYSLRFIPYYDLPPGFFDIDIVRDAELNDPRHMFLTEWCAEWISDSAGAFPMSLLETARDTSLIPKPVRDPVQDKHKRYIFGIDVGRENDATSIVIFELGYPNKLIWIRELEYTPYQQQAKIIFEFANSFRPEMIYMDAGGGGHMLRDMLADPEAVGMANSERIVEVDTPVGFSGRRILQLCDFTPQFIEDANNNTKALLEQGVIKLPAPVHPIDMIRKSNSKSGKGLKEIDLVQELINQVSAVVITKTTTKGLLHYDLPKASVKQFGLDLRRKDLYTAFILAGKCAYDLDWKPKADRTIIQAGVVKEIERTNALTLGLNNDKLLSTRIVGPKEENSGNILLQGGVIVPRHGKKR